MDTNLCVIRLGEGEQISDMHSEKSWIRQT